VREPEWLGLAEREALAVREPEWVGLAVALADREPVAVLEYEAERVAEPVNVSEAETDACSGKDEGRASTGGF